MDAQDDNQIEIANNIRHQTVHHLMSPLRAVTIVADLLAEELAVPEPNVDLIRDLSRQLSASTDDLLVRVRELSEDPRG